MFSGQCQEKGLEYHCHINSEVDDFYIGDNMKLRQILINILGNAVKFTPAGGKLSLQVDRIARFDGKTSLRFTISDTGVGMSTSDIEKLSRGMFQANKKRNRSTGGIGLGLPIVYGFVRKMQGFVTIESDKKRGTTVRISIAQQVLDPTPCISVPSDRYYNIAFHVIPERFDVPGVRDFYRTMATDMARGLRVNLYSASSLRDLKILLEGGKITHVFMGDYEYNADPAFFDELAASGVVVAISADPGFAVRPGSRAIIMTKPLYGYPVAKVLSGELSAIQTPTGEITSRPEFRGLRALVVDDEPTNLVVARGLFNDYGMVVDTAASGREAIDKFKAGEYDVIFMDHMMPEMDGIEAMKHIRYLAAENDRSAIVIALTANAVSGARDMFLGEGFDGFISKPISLPDFERTMNRVLSAGKGGKA
jgi:CheY-like chemotaxis protein